MPSELPLKVYLRAVTDALVYQCAHLTILAQIELHAGVAAEGGTSLELEALIDGPFNPLIGFDAAVSSADGQSHAG
jgi:hypothetical protein